MAMFAKQVTQLQEKQDSICYTSYIINWSLKSPFEGPNNHPHRHPQKGLDNLKVQCFTKRTDNIIILQTDWV